MNFKRSLILEKIETYIMNGTIGKKNIPIVKIIYKNQDLVKNMKETRDWNELLIHPTHYTSNKTFRYNDKDNSF